MKRVPRFSPSGLEPWSRFAIALSPVHCTRNQPTATAASMPVALILRTPPDPWSTSKLYITVVSTGMHTLII